MTQPEQPITPKSHDFDYFLSRAPFRVPQYQRAFDWEEDEVSEFARDVMGLVVQRLMEKRGRHFFGAVLSVFDSTGHYYEVVDGQQRLATEMLCLKELHKSWLALAEKAKKAGKKSVHKTAQEYAKKVSGRLGQNEEPVLTLSPRDTQFFFDLLDGTAKIPKPGDHQSHKRLWRAQQTLRSELFDPLLAKAIPYASRLQRLIALDQALLEDGYLVHLYTQERADGSQLFTVLNDRGRPLSDGDLLRTHTLTVLGKYPGQMSGAEEDWDEILRHGDVFVKKFLVTYYVSVTGDRPPPAQLVARFRRYFLDAEMNSPVAAAKLRTFIGELREEADTFASIRVGDWPFANSQAPERDKDRLVRLVKALRHDLAHPLLLAVARVDDEKTFRYLVGMLELFVFRYINIVRASPDRLSNVYYDHARTVRKEGTLAKATLRKTLKRFVKDYAPDDLFELHLRELRFESPASRKLLIRHFLTTVDDYEDWFQAGATGPRRVNTKAVVYDLKEVNLEHIYPQNPKKKVEELEQVKHALGNLTLLDERDGKIAGNADFKKKKPVYEKSRFAITKELTSVEDWDAAAVADRFVFYAERAKKIFTVR